MTKGKITDIKDSKGRTIFQIKQMAEDEIEKSDIPNLERILLIKDGSYKIDSMIVAEKELEKFYSENINFKDDANFPEGKLFEEMALDSAKHIINLQSMNSRLDKLYKEDLEQKWKNAGYFLQFCFTEKRIRMFRPLYDNEKEAKELGNIFICVECGEELNGAEFEIE